ncbi:hypothetical protein O181_093405 [Austropuccinia psidii MF-1]|uniref:Uncharacterized protein n=1 Tax=Austropuccinia psidii MF-1 TaxID=1389203 RepID=A0A9Q3J1M8_9BASI|nr:hypothetical protein [Austropuccinia psidii MF-1]
MKLPLRPTAPTPAPATAKALAHTTAPTPSLATAQAPTHTTAQALAPAAPTNGQCHLTLCPHMLCLCVHVSHPCTCGILWWAQPVSPAKF